MDIKNLDEIGLSEYAKKLQQMIDEGPDSVKRRLT